MAEGNTSGKDVVIVGGGSRRDARAAYFLSLAGIKSDGYRKGRNRVAGVGVFLGRSESSGGSADSGTASTAGDGIV